MRDIAGKAKSPPACCSARMSAVGNAPPPAATVQPHYAGYIAWRGTVDEALARLTSVHSLTTPSRLGTRTAATSSSFHPGAKANTFEGIVN